MMYLISKTYTRIELYNCSLFGSQTKPVTKSATRVCRMCTARGDKKERQKAERAGESAELGKQTAPVRAS